MDCFNCKAKKGLIDLRNMKLCLDCASGTTKYIHWIERIKLYEEKHERKATEEEIRKLR